MTSKFQSRRKWNWLKNIQENAGLSQRLKRAEAEAAAWKEFATLDPPEEKDDDDVQQQQRVYEIREHKV